MRPARPRPGKAALPVSRLRIVGGELRGRRIEVPPGDGVRPTADRTRQGLFDVLEHAGLGPGGATALAGARVLDAFCGTGALAFEALSRGAAEATLFDTDTAALACAKRNAEALGVADRVRIQRGDAAKAPPRTDTPATLVFLDPPWEGDLGPAALAMLSARGWIGPETLVSLETDAKRPLSTPPGFRLIDVRTWGRARIALLRQE